ncbi:hypothetical protein GTA08_BOTSDO08764 [Neofusicoccum parvum]|uniref:Uncharacterized protein n=1 Tax=Neofusicoccum parvum TaxID=310453 RepID=A0ACB5SM87_9PEZI|nr:hypothetical protein GTA08_BOTSDO08764 [Neofusicoccum parvum]
MPYDPRVAIPTLTGSVLSCATTSCVLISYIVYADQQRSFRHALVLNLALAEFINSLNNSISGIYAVSHRGIIDRGTACTINGWVGQWSVQAADFSILAIAIITLLTITRQTYMPNASLSRKILICASVWLVPTITSSTAAGLDELTPVSGNWCWISGKRTDLRYALGHGWRFTIIFTTILIYLYIWYYMRQHFSQLSALSRTYVTATDSENTRGAQDEEAIEMQSGLHVDLRDVQVEYQKRDTGSTKSDATEMARSTHQSYSGSKGSATSTRCSDPESLSVPEVLPAMNKTRSKTFGFTVKGPRKPQRSRNHVEREIRKMLLLNAYPILYVCLWMPGIINRIVEATGHSSKALAILQSSTQYVGLANALTYGFNEHLREQIRGWFAR